MRRSVGADKSVRGPFLGLGIRLPFFGVAFPELTAGGVDVGAAGAAEVGDGAVRTEFDKEGCGLSEATGGVGAAAEAEAGGVVAEEVDMHAPAVFE